jgi:hypothetical protein
MMPLLLAEAAANAAAKDGSQLGAVAVVTGILLFLLLIVLLAGAAGQREGNPQPPTFTPITPIDDARLPPAGGSGAPVTGEIHVKRMIVLAPKAGTGSQHLRD